MAEHEHAYELTNATCDCGNGISTQEEIEHLLAHCRVKSVAAKCACGEVLVQAGGGPVESAKGEASGRVQKGAKGDK